MHIPTMTDVLLAQRQIHPYLARTPLHTYPALNALIGTEIYVKHENYQPVGAFKLRGGINLISQLSPEEQKRGVIAASTGNHGQSVAYAARLFGVRAIIVVPEGANPGKVAAMQGMEAQVLFHGSTFDEAQLYCELLAKEHGYRYIHSGNEPLLISGVGTEALEMLEDQPELDSIIVPIGGGSGASGTCIVAQTLKPSLRVIGVQAADSPAAYESWKQGALIEMPNRTKAEGLATGRPFSLPQAIMKHLLKEFILVNEEELTQAMLWYLERAHTLAEGAGAASLAAAYKLRAELQGTKVGIICSGGNASLEQLRNALQ